MGHFPAPKAQGHFDLIALADELVHGAHFDLIIMFLDAGADFDFLDHDDALLFARLALFLLRLVLVLAVVHDLGDRRTGIGRNLDKVEARINSALNSVGSGNDADIIAICVDQAYVG